MPPSRRRPATPPPRRPRVAGLRHPGQPHTEDTEPDTPTDSISGSLAPSQHASEAAEPNTEVFDRPDFTEPPGTPSGSTPAATDAAADTDSADAAGAGSAGADAAGVDEAAAGTAVPSPKPRHALSSRAQRAAGRRAKQSESTESEPTESESAESRSAGARSAAESDDGLSDDAGTADELAPLAGTEQPEPMPAAESGTTAGYRRTSTSTLVLLAVVIVVFGAFAVVAAIRSNSLRGDSNNTALTDNATTSQVIGQVTNDINTAFSYNYTNLNKTKQAVQKMLTGKAIAQYNQLFKTVEQQAPAQKLIVTITVQTIGVQSLEGDNAHVLIFANQVSTKVASNQKAAAGSMFAVDAVRQSGQWKISNIDLFS